MNTPQFIDISQWNPKDIDWTAYKAWSASVDGVSRVAMRSSYGYGYRDAHFNQYRQEAINAGIDILLYYHYSYPSLNSAIAEANSQFHIVGSVRPQDILILDFEENVDAATSTWAYLWLATQEANYGKLPGIYASSAYIAEHLQDSRLARYPLWLANWQYTPDERPPVPAPWQSYQFVQFTDKATNVPGIPGIVDCNIFLGVTLPIGGNTMPTIPQGWSDDGQILRGPDGTPVVLGFRDHVLKSNWDKDNVPLEPEHHDLIIEQSNQSLGAGQSQAFRWTRLGYTPKMGVYESWVGQELLWYQKVYPQILAKIEDLQRQIADLKANGAGDTSALQAQITVLQGKIAQAVKDLQG